jgi:aryl-alcohol dehydrogenase-like predicted oxidoreductase
MLSPGPGHPLADITPFVYGTTRLGHGDVPRDQRLQIARLAAGSGVWLHTSRQYDDALEVLGEVYAEGVAAPPTIYKLGGESIETIRDTISQNLDPLGLAAMTVGQLSPSGPFGAGLAEGSREILDGLHQIKADGLVGQFVMEVFPWTSDAPLRALRGGHLDDAVDAFIFYLNPLQRFATNELWDELVARNCTVIAMRTIAGGPVHRLRDVPGAAWKPYLQQRAVEVAPIFERSGIDDWTEFCVRFAHSFSNVIATVGSTSRAENLRALIDASNEPLPDEIVDELSVLQRRWSDDTDVLAEPWTM